MALEAAEAPRRIARVRRRAAERGEPAARAASVSGSPPSPKRAAMRVAKWLTGLLCLISLLLTGSWEVRFHPRQGKVAVGAARSAQGGVRVGGTDSRRPPGRPAPGISEDFTGCLGVVESRELGTSSPGHRAGTRGDTGQRALGGHGSLAAGKRRGAGKEVAAQGGGWQGLCGAHRSCGKAERGHSVHVRVCASVVSLGRTKIGYL